MKNKLILTLSLSLALGFMNSALACGGAKKADRASATQKIESVQALPAATQSTPAVAEADGCPACPACPGASHTALKEGGYSEGKTGLIPASNTDVKAVEANLKAEKVSGKSGCAAKASASCAPKAEGAALPAPVDQTSKKTS